MSLGWSSSWVCARARDRALRRARAASRGARGADVRHGADAPAARGCDRSRHGRGEPRRLPRGARHGAPPLRGAEGRARRRGADRRRDRGARRRHPVAPPRPDADARAQPRVVDHAGAAPLRRARELPGLRARVADDRRPGPAAPSARQLRQAQRALGARAQRPGGGDARRAAAPRRAAGRRAGVGVLLRVRRRAAAVGERARAGHRAAGDHARGDEARPPGGRLPRGGPGPRRVPDPGARRRCRRHARGHALRAVLVRAPACASSTASCRRSSGCSTTRS